MRKSLIILFCFWIGVALFAEFIANDDPLMYRDKGELHCGACQEWMSNFEFNTPESAEVLWQPIIPYDDAYLEPSGFILLPPFTDGSKGIHLLGTDSQSRDLLAGIIYGSRYALLIALFTTLFSGLIGIFLGVIAGYYGDSRYRMSIGTLILWLLLLLYGGFLISQGLLAGWLAILCLVLLLMVPFLLLKKQKGGVVIPLDTLISKLIEILDSLPALFVLLAWIAIVEDWQIINLSLLIAFFTWPAFARLSRVEISKWLEGDWVRGLQSLKMSDAWIISNQLIPLIMVPLTVHAAFVGAGAISIEATLSFLGFGLGPETVSWGSLLNEARQYFHAWWLVLFPGLCLFSLLWGLNRLARDLQRKRRSSSQTPKESLY